jgi:hypothetical protein
VKACFIILSLFLSGFAFGQVLKTVVPQQPIVVGESFQVQYVVEDANNSATLASPSFPGFRFVSGPNIYTGKMNVNGKQARYKNFVFTLEALAAGRFSIPAAVSIINGHQIKINGASVIVVAQNTQAGSSSKQSADQTNSIYFLEPGEDAMKKISENLLLKLVVDKNTCYVGEPVVATFKLYSRLQSRSDVIKNPGFYGFSVYDMINVNDNLASVEKLNGNFFDVHTIRRVQLYPLQPGSFTIDAMELKNKVEFSRSTVRKKTEQQVIENMYGGPGEPQSAEGTEVYESISRTGPVAITVKPLPGKNASDSFMGAVGHFSIESFLEKDSLQKNEEGALIVKIKGAGNFPQINPPTIDWPKGLEFFEPTIVDTFDKTRVPLHGERSFRYAFVSNSPGRFNIAGIAFSFFNPDTKHYTRIVSRLQTALVLDSLKSNAAQMEQPDKESGNSYVYWIAVLLLVAVAVSAFIIIRERKKARLAKLREESEKRNPQQQIVPVTAFLEDAKRFLEADDKSFYRSLNSGIWGYFVERLTLSGSHVNKDHLFRVLEQTGVPAQTNEKIFGILRQVEAGMYTGADMRIRKDVLLDNATALLEEIDVHIS